MNKFYYNKIIQGSYDLIPTRNVRYKKCQKYVKETVSKRFLTQAGTNNMYLLFDQTSLIATSLCAYFFKIF
jgi:hypothetical protein